MLLLTYMHQNIKNIKILKYIYIYIYIYKNAPENAPDSETFKNGAPRFALAPAPAPAPAPASK